VKLFRTASLGDWIAVVTFIGVIALFTVRASSNATHAIDGVAENKASIGVLAEKLESVEDSVMTLGITNSKEHQALRKTTTDTYTVVKLLAEKNGIIVP
jgi:anionic cell wall polymer biosynthesis LytR-Cps2A-Psr (LCP) family protein